MEETLERFTFSLPYQALYAFVPKSYAFANWDADGVEELLVMDVQTFCLLTLDYTEEKVSGTIKDNVNSQDYQDLNWVEIGS